MIAIEYPGYGLYENEYPCEKTILEDAALILQHSIQNLKYKEENIILVGRSLGTGVAVAMGTIFPKLRGIVLISPFLSIRDVAEKLVGKLFAKVVPDIFRTYDHIQNLKTPVLFIHGVKDKLTPCTASKLLYERCNAPKMINLSPYMDHHKIDLRNDIILPILKFFVEKLNMEEYKLMYACEDTTALSMLGSMDDAPSARSQLNKSNVEECEGYSPASIEVYKKRIKLAEECDLAFE